MRLGWALLVVAGSASAGTLPASKLATRQRADAYPVLADPPADGACYVSFASDAHEWVDGAADWRSAAFNDDSQRSGIERLVLEPAPELERTLVVGRAAVWRHHIPLVEVARVDGIVVYAYRAGTTVVLVTPSLPGSTAIEERIGEPWDAGLVDRESDCTFAVAALHIGPSSKPAQITGALRGKQSFRVDASITQTSRDPEPLLSVTARRW